MNSFDAPHSLLGLLVAALLSTACSSSSSSQDARGTEAAGGRTSSGGANSIDGSASTGHGGNAGSSGSTSKASSGADTKPSSTEATQVCRAAITAQVERSNFCFGYDIGYTQHLDACPDYYFNADSNRSVSAVAACVPQLKNTPCSELSLSLIAACLTPGKRPAGAGCAYPSQCLGGVCESTSSSCGICRDGNFPPGATCQRFQCQPGDFCDEDAGKCVSRSTFVYASEGEPCHNSKTSTVFCQGDLQCTNVDMTMKLACQKQQRFNCGARQCEAGTYCGDSTTGACTPAARLGEACSETRTGDLPTCDFSLRCWNGKCVKRRVAGESCDPNNPCSEYFECVNGVCRLRDCPA
jgi:hypothetical protein